MLWIAFALPSDATPPLPDARPDPGRLQALTWWALQFSPRVAQVDGMVVLEAQTSERLFGGRRTLLQRLSRECVEYGVAALAVAPTALAAQALVGELLTHATDGFGMKHVICGTRSLAATLDAMPVAALAGLRPHAATMQRLGCACLGDIRRLPRGGLARRFPGLLDALDGAYGLIPEVFEWVRLPERFDVRLEFGSRVEVAAGLLFGARRLLLQLQGWLAARQAGAGGVALHWEHDLQRRGDAASGHLDVRTGTATRDTAHLAKLLAEHLARLELVAPVVAIRLEALDVEPLAVQSGSLLPDETTQGEGFAQLVERLVARLGEDRVQSGHLVADHRPERMQAWACAANASRTRRRPAALPGSLADAPPWLLREPLRLAVIKDRPMYQGPLELLDGPQRLETGWWAEGDAADTAIRDYFIARSKHAGLVWVYRVRGHSGETPDGWYLQGIYG